MKIFKNLSIKSKLILVITLITCAMLVAGLTINLLSNLSRYKNELVTNTAVISKLFGGFSAAPMTFGYPEKVKEILSQLNSISNIENAIIYDEKGQLFSSYFKTDSVFNRPPKTMEASYEFSDGYLHIYEPIKFKDHTYGVIYFRTSTQELDNKISKSIISVFWLIIVLILITILISFWLQRLISNPIVHLTKITQKISKQNDYSIRLTRHSTDEIGILYDGFNSMLEQIQKREADLKDSERQLAEIINAVPHSIFIKNSNGEFLLVNNAFASFYNTTPSQMIGKSHQSMHHFDSTVNNYLDDDKYVIQEKKPIEIPELPFYDANQTLHFLRTIKIPFSYYQKDCVLGVAVNITSEKKAKQELKDSQEQFISFMDVLPAGAFIKNAQNDFFYMNQYLQQNFDTRSWMEKKTDPLSNENDDSEDVFINGLPILHPVSSLETRMDKNNSKRFLETWRFPIGRENMPTFIGGIFIDVTERKDAEERIQFYIQELERNNQELEEFNYVASHDLREPLRTLTSYCELLKEDVGVNLSDDATEDINFIIDAAGRMNVLIIDLLQLSRAGRVELNSEMVDLNECMTIVTKDLGAYIKQTGGTVNWDKLPIVKGDTVQITRVLQNLINNGLKFHAEEAPVINVWAVERKACWEIFVSDNGIGIKPQYIEQIFLPFKRLHSRDKYEGSGIGLAIVNKIVKRHNGVVTVNSEPEKGTTFSFTFEKYLK